MLVISLFLVFCTVGMIGYTVIPAAYARSAILGEKRRLGFAGRLEHLMPRQEVRKISRIFVLAPIILGVFFCILFPEGLRLFGLLFGLVSGFIFPSIYIQAIIKTTRNKFGDQLVDALMIMSSSFRGGLSLVQAMEAVVDEMPDPINKEFGVVLGENKMGVSLDEALNHFYSRMSLTSVQQMITAILLARETGGNLPVIFSRIVTNIRETKKIQQNLATLTIQGKIQGAVMSFLPIGFAFVVYSASPRIFQHMFQSDMGRAMLMYAVVSETIGAVLIWKISTFKDF
jgi:tight adherence protein B